MQVGLSFRCQSNNKNSNNGSSTSSTAKTRINGKKVKCDLSCFPRCYLGIVVLVVLFEKKNQRDPLNSHSCLVFHTVVSSSACISLQKMYLKRVGFFSWGFKMRPVSAAIQSHTIYFYFFASAKNRVERIYYVVTVMMIVVVAAVR